MTCTTAVSAPVNSIVRHVREGPIMHAMHYAQLSQQDRREVRRTLRAQGKPLPADAVLEVDEAVREYRLAHPAASYELALKLVLDCNPDLKNRYARFAG